MRRYLCASGGAFSSSVPGEHSFGHFTGLADQETCVTQGLEGCHGMGTSLMLSHTRDGVEIDSLFLSVDGQLKPRVFSGVGGRGTLYVDNLGDIIGDRNGPYEGSVNDHCFLP